MSACEKCWADAALGSVTRGVSQVEEYNRLLAERADNPCRPEFKCAEFDGCTENYCAYPGEEHCAVDCGPEP